MTARGNNDILHGTVATDNLEVQPARKKRWALLFLYSWHTAATHVSVSKQRLKPKHFNVLMVCSSGFNWHLPSACTTKADGFRTSLFMIRKACVVSTVCACSCFLDMRKHLTYLIQSEYVLPRLLYASPSCAGWSAAAKGSEANSS